MTFEFKTEYYTDIGTGYLAELKWTKDIDANFNFEYYDFDINLNVYSYDTNSDWDHLSFFFANFGKMDGGFTIDSSDISGNFDVEVIYNDRFGIDADITVGFDFDHFTIQWDNVLGLPGHWQFDLSKFNLYASGSFEVFFEDYDNGDRYNIYPNCLNGGNTPPVADVSSSPSNPTAPETVVFDASGSYDIDGTIQKIKWDLDDNGWDTSYWLDFSSNKIKTNYFPNSGSYTIKCIVRDNDLDTDEISHTIFVGGGSGNVIVDANGPYSEDVGNSIQFTGTVSGGTGNYNYYWNFGDGASSSLQNPTHSYSSSGEYTATFTVTDSNGASDSDTAEVDIGPQGYTLIAEPYQSTGGWIEKIPDKPLYQPNEQVTLHVHPYGAKVFVNWIGDYPPGHEEDNPLTLTMDSDKELYAYFAMGGV